MKKEMRGSVWDYLLELVINDSQNHGKLILSGKKRKFFFEERARVPMWEIYRIKITSGYIYLTELDNEKESQRRLFKLPIKEYARFPDIYKELCYKLFSSEAPEHDDNSI